MKADLLNQIVVTLCELGIFENDKLKPRSNKIWKLASDAIGNKISPETLNVYARLNRYNILTQVKQKCGIAEEIISSVNSSLNTSNESQKEDPNFTITEVSNHGLLKKLCFTVKLDEKLWKTVAPSEETDGSGSRYTSLNGPWTDIIAKHCYEDKKIPCAYVFKRAKITNSVDSAWLKITGNCKECKSPFEGHCLNEPIPGTGIAIAVTVFDTRGIPHTQKRPLALLNAISLSFNERKLQTYITDCFLWILGEDLQHPLHTYIRLDINHLIKMMCRKKVFSGKPGKLKDFYIRCIGVMTICETLKDFKKMLAAIFTVALSECDGQNEYGQDIISQQKEDYLLDRIKTFSFDNDKNQIDEDTEWEWDHDEPSEVDDSIKNFVGNLKSNAEAAAENCMEHQRPNPYFLPEIVNPLVKLAQYFPMWTNVMMNKFSSQYSVATSSIIEEYFKDVKNSDLSNHSSLIRADKFIVTHLRSIEAQCKFERAAAKRKAKFDVTESTAQIKKQISLKSTSPTKLNNHLNQIENWKGRNSKLEVLLKEEIEYDYEELSKHTHQEQDLLSPRTPFEPILQNKETRYDVPRTPRGKYLTPSTDIQLVHNRPLRRKKQGILRNGNSLGPAWIGRRLVKIKNTCPFDSAVELLSTAYMDNYKLKEKIDEVKENNATLLLVENYAINGPTAQLYQQRASILSDIYGGGVNSVLDCKDNVTFLVSRVFEDLPSCHLTKSCESCGTICELRTSIEVDHRAVSTLKIPEYIADYFLDRTSTCGKCYGILTTQINPGMQVLLDLEFALDREFHREIYPDAPDKINITDLPKKIVIKEKSYILNGLIGYIPAHSKDEVGHYIAICRRVTDNWEKHDDRYLELERIGNAEKCAVKATLVMYSEI